MRSFLRKENRSKPKDAGTSVFCVLPVLIAVFLAALLQGCFFFPDEPSDTPGVPSDSSIPVFEPSPTPATPTLEPSPTPEISPTPTAEIDEHYYDVVVYGGTPSGLCAAIAAAREGLKVAVIESSSHIGGMMTGGLSSSDVGNQNVVGGLAKEFFDLLGTLYNSGGIPVYSFEPHMAETAFLELAVSDGVDIFINEPLREESGVQKDGATIISITTLDESVYFAKVFIDCTYEGDLMAMSGVSYTVGREGTDMYGETLAGVSPFTLINNFYYDTPAYYWSSTDLMPGVAPEIYDGIGQGDGKLPAYNFRLCITDVPENKVEFAEPENYDANQYELLLVWIYTMWSTEGYRELSIDDVLSIGRLPGDKADANNKGPFSSDLIGGSWDYPEASYEMRELIYNRHKDYLQGFLYFLANDIRVPLELRENFQSYGLAADEFTDNGNWPYQLYIREGRRMTGDFVMTQEDLQVNREKDDSIGMGSYPIDSHNVQRVATEDGLVQNEGEILTWIGPYQLPYRIIVPKEREAANLLVPVCVSASHVAYSSIRMEPQYMIMGEAAGVAAKLAIEQNCSVQKIDIASLTARLQSRGAVLSLP